MKASSDKTKDPPELYRRHRPQQFKNVLGQDSVVAFLTKAVQAGNVPHVMLFSGPSGCGKTTVARILQQHLHCADAGFFEINAADASGINDIRKIRTKMSLAPPAGSKCRVYLMDEAERLTPDAQGALLKTLEDTPDHVYFILATTNPQKLRKEIHTRATHLQFRTVPPKAIKQLIEDVASKERVKVSEDVTDKIIEVAEGSARKALVLLGQVLRLDEDDALDLLVKASTSHEAVNIVKALLFNPRWVEVSKLVKGCEEEPEQIRRLSLAYATSVLLGGGKNASRAYLVIEAFRDHWYDCGKAGLAAACFDVCSQK